MMKNILFLFVFILAGYVTVAQKSKLVFYTEQGEAFYLNINGIPQNYEPVSNLMISDLVDQTCKVTLKFEDPALGEISKNLTFGQGSETTYVIRMNASDEWILRYVKEVPVAQAPAPPADRSVIVLRTTAPAKPVKTGQSQSTANQATTTSTTSEVATEGGSVGMNVQEPGGNITINFNVSGVGTSTSTSTTTSATTSTVTGNTDVQNPEPEPVAVIEKPKPVAIPGYSGLIGCDWPMSEYDFSMAKNSIESKSFEDSKLTLAKQVFDSKCMLCIQVKEIMKLFSFEESRLEFAKYAYGYTYDLSNFYIVNDAFSFESSIDELNKYIRSQNN